MYIFKNAFKNMSIYRTRNILLFVMVFILSFLCCMALIAWQGTKQYEESNASAMNIAVDFGTDISQAGVNTASILYEGMGISVSVEMPFNVDAETLEELHEFIDLGNPAAAYDYVNTHLSGSENFKSYALDSDSRYLALTKSKTATAFSDHQYVNIIKNSPEEFRERAEQEFFSIADGKMFDDDVYEYQCIIDLQLANERNLKTGDKINVSLNTFNYEVRVTGIYTSRYIENYLNYVVKENLVVEEIQPTFIGENNGSNYYFPSIYINLPFYEEIQTKKSVGIDLDFNVIGISSDEALIDFVSGKKTIAYGKVFDPAKDDYECLISEDLAKKNRINVGDEIVLRGNNDNSKDYHIKVAGIYHNSANEGMESMTYLTSSTSFYRNNILKVPLDTIYMSFSALTKIIDDIDSYSSDCYPKLLSLKLVFKDTKDMNDFYRAAIKQDYQMRTKFATASTYANEYFSQLASVKRITSYALFIFVVVIIIAILFMFMFNAYNIRERQYEIGVLTSIGMAKWKIALQFFGEIIIIVMVATILGSGLGSLASTPVSRYLTEQNVMNRESQEITLAENFGREVDALSLKNAQDPTIDVSLRFNNLLWIWAAFIAVTIVSTSSVIFLILDFEPISILSDL